MLKIYTLYLGRIFANTLAYIKYGCRSKTRPQCRPQARLDTSAWHWLKAFAYMRYACADPEGRTGGPDHLKNHKNIGFSSNIDLDPLKITKLPSQHLLVGHYRHASETRFTGGLMIAPFSDISTLCPSHTTKKRRSVLDPLFKTFWIRAWYVSNYHVLAHLFFHDIFRSSC